MEFTFEKAVVFSFVENKYDLEYVEEECEVFFDKENGEIIITLTKNQNYKYVEKSVAKDNGMGYRYGIDLYFKAYVNGLDLSGYTTAYEYYPTS